MLYQTFHPLLLALDAEKAHHLSLVLFNRTICFIPQPNLLRSSTEVMSITFPNKVGLANILKKYDVDGVIATNTIIDKTAVARYKNAYETGGLLGKLIQQPTYVVRLLANKLAVS